MKISSLQLQAGIVLAGLTQDELARLSGTSVDAINKFITGTTAAPRGATMSAWLRVIDARGVEFTDDEGVRRKKGVQIFEGVDDFTAFYDFLYEHTCIHGGDICLSVSDETLLSSYRKDPAEHYNRMLKLKQEGGFNSFRIIASKSKFATTYDYNEYRQSQQDDIAPTAFYVFGDCIALIAFDTPKAPKVVVIEDRSIADAYRRTFNTAWVVSKIPEKVGA